MGTLQECDAGNAGRSIPSLLLRMSRTGCCLNVSVTLFASAAMKLAALFSRRVFPVGGRTALRARALMLRWCGAMVDCRNGPADQPLDIAQKRDLLSVAK